MYTEASYENSLIELFQGMGYSYVYGPSVDRDYRSPLYEAELEAALPNTFIKYCYGMMAGNGWRDLQNYFDMRDLLGMPYNTW